MGKSTVARYLESSGEKVIDTDEVARALVAPGQPALEEIRAEFGDDVLQADGTLDRHRLAQIVFEGSEQRTRLEAILHPRIRAEWLTAAAAWEASGAKHGVVVIPLLFETNAEKQFGLTICVACSSYSQQKRLRDRGWDDQQTENRIRAQRPISEKMDRSDRVIWNESTVEICEAQARRIFDSL